MRSGLVIVAATLLALVPACRDLSRFSSGDDHFEGSVVDGAFVRSGVEPAVRMCLTLDTDHLQDAPGSLTTSDGRFRGTPLRPIPQIWHDPISTLSFGEGRERNLVYAATPERSGSAGPVTVSPTEASDAMVVVSLIQSGDVEVRVIRGAPPSAGSLFAVFPLKRKRGTCSF